MAFIAASVVAFAAMPNRRGEARTFFYAAELLQDDKSSEPIVRFEVDERGRLHITRYGLDGITDVGAMSLAVVIIGFDVTINERLTPSTEGNICNTGRVVVDCLGAERYHIQYRNEKACRSTAFTMTLKPGYSIERQLSI